MQMKQMTKEQLEQTQRELKAQYDELCKSGLSLDMSRGKPGPDQLDLCDEVLQVKLSGRECYTEGGFDCRNYGILDGIPEMKQLFSELLDIPTEQIIVGGNSSLNMMYDTIARAFTFGFYNSDRPWSKEEKLKFLCPAPGYDRHFAISELFGIEMITIPMRSDGPDMDLVEQYVSTDAAVKGIWCIPKYSNPSGVTYSDEVVRRFAALKPAAKDFRIFWDNAYAVHDLYDEGDTLLNLLKECEAAGNPDMPLMFSSTSKITFPGSGVALMAASVNNLEFAKRQLTIQTIGPDKLNQLRHVKALRNKAGVLEFMKRHAGVLRPKFELVLETLDRELGDLGIASWSRPRGGYFVSFDATEGTAKTIFDLCKKAGLTLTNVGATFPYGKDPLDRNLRLAPSYPSLEELQNALQVFCVCVKLATVQKLLNA